MFGLACWPPSLLLTHDGEEHGDSAYGAQVSLPADFANVQTCILADQGGRISLAVDRQQRDFVLAEKRQAGQHKTASKQSGMNKALTVKSCRLLIERRRWAQSAN